MTPTEPTTILIVDKEPAIQRLLGSFLKSRGFSTSSASSWTEADEWIEKNTAHIILSDTETDGGEGVRLIGMLRNKAGMSQIVAMSANPSVDKIVEAYHLGASDYLIKPFTNMNDVANSVNLANDRLARWRLILSNTLAGEGL